MVKLHFKFRILIENFKSIIIPKHFMLPHEFKVNKLMLIIRKV